MKDKNVSIPRPDKDADELRRMLGDCIMESDLKTRIMDASGEDIRFIDVNFNVTQVNKTILDMLEIKREEAVGMKCYDQMKGDICGTDECTLKVILSGSEHVDRIIDKTTPSGKKISVMQSAKPVRDSNGKIIGIVESLETLLF